MPFPLERKITPVENYTLLTLCGKSHIDMLYQSLASIFNNWDLIPEILVYTDGSLSRASMEKRLAPFLSIVKIKTYEPDNNLNENLTVLSQKHVLGKKLMLIAKHALEKRTIWFDTDMLWFKQLNFEEEFKNYSYFLKTSTDYQPAYSKNIYNSTLKEAPFVNTGLVLAFGNILSFEGSNELLKKASENPDHFTEQTILAIAIKLGNKETFSLDKIACVYTDRQTLAPTYRNKNWISRHYVGSVRHLFWRDAFFLRVGIKA